MKYLSVIITLLATTAQVPGQALCRVCDGPGAAAKLERAEEIGRSGLGISGYGATLLSEKPQPRPKSAPPKIIIIERPVIVQPDPIYIEPRSKTCFINGSIDVGFTKTCL